MVSEKDLIGKTEEEAVAMLINVNARYRIIRRDNLKYGMTADYVVMRYNLEIDNGYVSHVEMG
jgi:hypothetical protein